MNLMVNGVGEMVSDIWYVAATARNWGCIEQDQ